MGWVAAVVAVQILVAAAGVQSQHRLGAGRQGVGAIDFEDNQSELLREDAGVVDCWDWMRIEAHQ